MTVQGSQLMVRRRGPEGGAGRGGWRRAGWCAAAVCLTGAGAAAQPAGATRVEPGIADVGPLSVPGRVPPMDLRKPVDFEGVYTLGRVDAFGSDEVFLRVSGGVTAVFPRSVYEKSAKGLKPRIPAGTTFYIGELPEEFRPVQVLGPSSPLGVNLARDLRAGVAPPRAGVARHATQAGLPSIWENDEYRGARIGQIMRRAMATR